MVTFNIIPIDIILQPKLSNYEVISRILCKLDYPQIDSHHDVVLSDLLLPLTNIQKLYIEGLDKI